MTKAKIKMPERVCTKCKASKSIHFYSAAMWKRVSPAECRTCMQKINKAYKAVKPHTGRVKFDEKYTDFRLKGSNYE